MPLYLTYDNSKADGLGAQALRIVAIFSLSRFLKIKYVHSDIQEISEEFAHSSNGKGSEAAFEEFKKVFKFPSIGTPREFDIEVLIVELDICTLLKFLFKYSMSRKHVLLKILLPFKITDRLPFVYKYSTRLLRSNLSLLQNVKPTYSSKSFTIVCHARFGYGAIWTQSRAALKRTFLTPKYYSKIINAITHELSGKSNTRIIIHTDLAEKSTYWRPKHESTLHMLQESTGRKVSNSIFIKGRDLAREIHLSDAITPEIIYCGDFLQTFIDMCRADILIMSRSAFSYLAGLLNDNLVVWPSNHGHSKLRRWKSEKNYKVSISLDDIEFFSNWI